MDGLPWNTHKCHGVANHQQQLLQPDWAGRGGGGAATFWPQFRMWLKRSTKLMWWASLWGQKRCKHCESRSIVSNSSWPHGLYSPWNSPGQNTWVGCRSLLQGIFPTQGSNPGLPQCRWILYQLSHQVSLIWIFETHNFCSVWLSYSMSDSSPDVLSKPHLCLFTPLSPSPHQHSLSSTSH